jgi:hypothetical protein
MIGDGKNRQNSRNDAQSIVVGEIGYIVSVVNTWRFYNEIPCGHYFDIAIANSGCADFRLVHSIEREVTIN